MPYPRRRARIALFAGALALGACALVAASCIHDRRDIHAARQQPALRPGTLVARSYPLCPLLGPSTRDPGIYGTDLGYTVRAPKGDALAILFGDTWARPVDACQYSVLRSDDLQATLPAQRPAELQLGPPDGDEGAACRALHYDFSKAGDVTSWRRAQLYPSAVAKSKDALMDLGALRTPVAAFSDGRRLFAIFYRDDPLRCARSDECPYGMLCTSDPAYDRKPIGTCSSSIETAADSPPAFCRDDDDCASLAGCEHAARGVCLSPRPFALSTESGPVAPDWYQQDPRRGIARTMYIAAEIGEQRPGDYAVVARFATNRFTNVVARTVAHFDPDDPSRSDYRPGHHTLLVWGRASFFERGGAQSLPFLLYVPLADLAAAPANVKWEPRFFAGYEPSGSKPRWSRYEHDAVPIYGAEGALVRDAAGARLHFAEPEFDYVNQMTVSYVAPLRRWVMLYGGDVPAFMLADPKSGETPQAVHLQPSPGAIHMRSAPHPFGRAFREQSLAMGWSSPEPVLTRRAAAPYLACGRGGRKELPGCVERPDPDGPLDLFASLLGLSPGKRSAIGGACMRGELESAAQDELSGNPIGRLYAANIIDDWTADLGAGEGAEIYWNVSTWSPYQVVLIKTELKARP